MLRSLLCVTESERVCAGERGKGNIVCVFILFISRCIFMSYTQALQAAERLEKKNEGE